MPPRLHGHAAARVDEDHGGVGGAGARHHVARVLLVAGRVGDDEFALRRREIAVSDVDGDALLALDRQPVHQQRQIDLGLALAARRALQRVEPVAGHGLRIVEHAADERALAVIDAAGGAEAQHADIGLARGFAVSRRHQKYPARLRSSIDGFRGLVVEPRRAALAERGVERFGDDLLDRRRVRFDRQGAGDVADGAEAHDARLDRVVLVAAARRSETGSRMLPRTATGRSCA